MATIANSPLCTHRYALFVSYLGTRYNGSQRQTGREQPTSGNTIQEAIESSLEEFLPKKRCCVTSSSRTDKGVHALINCFSLPLMDFSLPTEKLKNLANKNLLAKNHDVIIKDVLLMPAAFHPRKDVVGREYIYRLAVINNMRQSQNISKFNSENMICKLPITEMYKVLPLPYLNLDKAQEAIDLLKGEHDFASFAKSADIEKDTVRVLDIDIRESNLHNIENESSAFTLYHIHFRSKSFLHNQIRRLVGTIIAYASYETVNLGDIRHLLKNPSSKSWSSKFPVAEPWGLFLSRLEYEKSSFEGSMKVELGGNEIYVDDEYMLNPKMDIN